MTNATDIRIIASAMTLALSPPAFSADMSGQWARGDGNAHVRIEPCGSNICAINTWVRPGTQSEKEGDKLIMIVKPTESGGYSGTAFDPQRDLTYKLTVTLKGDRMTTEGCVLAGIVCKGMNWTRIP